MNAVMQIKRKYIPAPNETPEQRRTREMYADPECFVKLAHKWDLERQAERERKAQEEDARKAAQKAQTRREAKKAAARRRAIVEFVASAVGGTVLAVSVSLLALMLG